jgi:hypothetical protein
VFDGCTHGEYHSLQLWQGAVSAYKVHILYIRVRATMKRNLRVCDPTCDFALWRGNEIPYRPSLIQRFASDNINAGLV